MPAGLSLDAFYGLISGAPETAGTFGFSVAVTDWAGTTFVQEVTLLIVPPPTISTVSLPSGTYLSGYLESLEVAGGTAPFTWSLVADSLPSGFSGIPGSPSLSRWCSGCVSGTPDAVGPYTFTIMVEDAYGVTDTQVFTIVIEPHALVIVTSGLLPGTVGQLYSDTLVAEGGMPPFNYSWSVVSGSLPNGLTLSGNVISGTPKGGAKTYNFTVEVSDGFVTTAKPLSIVISK